MTTTTPLPLTGAALFAIAGANLGAIVDYSDGQPRPPERFNKKLAEWKRRNGSGVLVAFSPRDPQHDWSHDQITLRTLDTDTIVMNMTYPVETDLRFEIATPRQPGMVLALDTYAEERREGMEAKHVFADEAALYHWGDRNRYSPLEQTRYSTRYVIVGEDGALHPYTPTR